MNPWYKSPLADGGYDVADYRSIEPSYGTIEEASAFITEAHKHGLKVIPDLVPNHTSEDHRWFRDAVASPIGHPSRDRYHIVDGRDDGSKPPNDWTSVFGGPAWSQLPDGQWYLHLFAPEQPDLNWTHPEVRLEFKEILRYWLRLGADGFRIDVAHGLAKDMRYPSLGKDTGDLLDGSGEVENYHPFWDRDELLEIVTEWRAVLDEFDGDRMMIAEAWIPPTRVPKYLAAGYHQVFNFKLLKAPWRASDYRDIVEQSVTAAAEVGATPTWVLANHDVVRETTRFGLPPETNSNAWLLDGPHSILDKDAGLRRARAAALIMLSLPGGCYLYQGQELGLPEVYDLPLDVLDDPVFERSGRTRKGRDGCRVPMPWTKDGIAFGFGESKPWLPQPVNWGEHSVEAQRDDKSSTLALYEQALKLRKDWCTGSPKLDVFDLGPDVVAYRRDSGLMVVANMGKEPIEMPSHRDILLRSGDGPGKVVAVDETVWIA